MKNKFLRLVPVSTVLIVSILLIIINILIPLIILLIPLILCVLHIVSTASKESDINSSARCLEKKLKE